MRKILIPPILLFSIASDLLMFALALLETAPAVMFLAFGYEYKYPLTSFFGRIGDSLEDTLRVLRGVTGYPNAQVFWSKKGGETDGRTADA